jgi:alkylation response protein AidB-like acyl-CoA dehydrogenase
MASTERQEQLDDLRRRYRRWLADHVPAGWRERVAGDHAATIELARHWMNELDSGGWAAPTWPLEHGGMNATIAEQLVMLEEQQRAGAPSTAVFGIALNHAGATLAVHGTPEQLTHLPRIRRGAEIWCQGFSEPDAGSDLAALQARAVRDGDHYVVSGQKVWSSFATDADWCLLLARTDPVAPKRKGVSYFLLDLRSPGVEIRPLRQITGSAEFCEIFLDEVAIPAGNLVGAENDGWRVSQTTLTTERGPFFLPAVQRLRRRAIDAFEALGADGARPGSAAAQSLARNYADVEILAELYNRVLTAQDRFGHAGAEASIVKLRYTDLLQRLTGDVLDALGPDGQLGSPLQPGEDRDGEWELDHLMAFGLAIGGGTSDIQRNLIGERVLGLPREPA